MTSTAPPAPTIAAPTAGYARGALTVGTGAILATVAHRIVAPVGALTWAVALGALAANLGMVPARVERSVGLVTRKALRIGVVLLGLSLPLGAIVALGARVIALVVATLVSTLVATAWLGQRLGLGRPRSLLIATGFAICGASAIAAMEENAGADEDDVAVAVAMVTICGTAAMVALPLLQHPLGLSSTQYGSWAGASVQEVGQVVAAASPAGAAAVAVAVVVKLTRVLLLAPVVGFVSARRRRAALSAYDGAHGAPPLVPAFVLGFLACVAIRSSGLVPEAALSTVSTAQDLVLAAALFGMGTAVKVRSLVTASGRTFALSAASTLLVASVSLAGVALLV